MPALTMTGQKVHPLAGGTPDRFAMFHGHWCEVKCETRTKIVGGQLFTSLVTGCDEFFLGKVNSHSGMNGAVKKSLVTGLVTAGNQFLRI